MSLVMSDDFPAASASFGRYSAVYDLLYHDKNYAAESDYVVRAVRSAIPRARDILELGCGTGRHALFLAGQGFNVYGIERSPEMVARAQSAARGSFSCEVGDVRSADMNRSFDAVIALFHVVSYQTSDADLRATFATAARHLAPGGAFLFDVWHGPAVLAQRPERRIKKVSDERMDVVRSAIPLHDEARRTVRVRYDVECRDRRSGETVGFSEDHLLRYLFADEIERLAAQAGLRVAASEEFMTGAPPSAATWSVAYLLRK